MLNIIQNLNTDDMISIGGGVAGIFGFVLAFIKSRKLQSLVKVIIPILMNVFKFLISNRKYLKKIINIEELKKLLTNMKGKVENETKVVTESAEEIKTTNSEISEKTDELVEDVKRLDETIQTADSVNTENKEKIENELNSNGFIKTEN